MAESAAEMVKFTHWVFTAPVSVQPKCPWHRHNYQKHGDSCIFEAKLLLGFILALMNAKSLRVSGVTTMRTSMAYPIRFWAVLLICLLAYQFTTEASADWCKYEKTIDLTLDLSASDVLVISAAAGDLDVTGVSGSDQAVIHGKACASKERWLEESEVNTSSGRRAEINVDLPEANGGWLSFGNNYAWIDLDIEVPEGLALEVNDSSGDMFLKNVASVELQDSSGDIEIEDAHGPISIRDSSGDIDVDEIVGDLTIESDSSGDIYASDIDGTVLVKQDSSGDIRISHVSHDVVVERDSSGDITATDVGGDFRVLKDGSGGIRYDDVKGEVQLPREG